MANEKIKILIIEDESALIYALRAKFAASGFDPTITLNGELALELAEKEKFDIILLDLLLPKLNGFEVLSRFRERPKTKSLPIIVFSNLDSEEDRKRAKELGATEYLMKAQTSLDEVIKIVKGLVK
ncbi:hypothetical protein A2841_00905 [Candidatus Kaiserbacteria bacterium RIFCSPHIGHO2_01_FULL_48_10]|uniref:Response regulatory domain-containing protein n=1 Tax=Candidatus Kaiserbacteria bacterium RIFCSPHIGHO2_01_FULL_48_10 TaxID=1798476 RepID=A0A1F6C563_9BACT|nr:MAG: hypothetical protein A2841_00905 [Candidatus Kaiserbacteria bacterium RIFCSPHIGHO2_01_FULL_48_10]HLC99963.1 response regulator [Patescibacteria group bacterium]